MNTVYDLWFEREYDDRADTELYIGIYASREDATAAIEELKEKPGFEEYPEGFQIHETLLGRTGWTEGFNTTFGPPPKDAASEAFDVPAWVAEGDDTGRAKLLMQSANRRHPEVLRAAKPRRTQNG